MVYLSLLALQPGGDRYHGTLAHELQHAAQAAADPYETAWVPRGRCGVRRRGGGAIEAGPKTSSSFRRAYKLTLWPDEFEAAGPHYAAAFSFVRYLAQRVGDDALASLFSSPLTGIEGVEAFLRRARD